eukprot:3447808-Prymnesium_polylepis.1
MGFSNGALGAVNVSTLTEMPNLRINGLRRFASGYHARRLDESTTVKHNVSPAVLHPAHIHGDRAAAFDTGRLKVRVDAREERREGGGRRDERRGGRRRVAQRG